MSGALIHRDWRDHWLYQGKLPAMYRGQCLTRLLYSLHVGDLPTHIRLERTCGDDRCISPYHHRKGGSVHAK